MRRAAYGDEDTNKRKRETWTPSTSNRSDYLVDRIQQDEELCSDDDEKPTVRSFEDAGVMTRNAGLVLRPPTAGFQISVVKSAETNSQRWLIARGNN